MHILCYLWYAQGKHKWALTPVICHRNIKHVYRDRIELVTFQAGSYTINDGKKRGLPVDHALVCSVDLD